MQGFSNPEANVYVTSGLRISRIEQLLRRLNDSFARQSPNVDCARVGIRYKHLSCGFRADPINRTTAVWIGPQVIETCSLNPSSVSIRSHETDHDSSIGRRYSFQWFPAEGPNWFRSKIVRDGFPVPISAIFGRHRSEMNQDVIKKLREMAGERVALVRS